jgi:hypothetical protein
MSESEIFREREALRKLANVDIKSDEVEDNIAWRLLWEWIQDNK